MHTPRVIHVNIRAISMHIDINIPHHIAIIQTPVELLTLSFCLTSDSSCTEGNVSDDRTEIFDIETDGFASCSMHRLGVAKKQTPKHLKM